MRAATLLCLALLLPVSLAFAQTGRIAGTVTDGASGEPIPGVNVVIDGTTQGATTNVEGLYSIIGVRPGTYSLRASFVGYTPSVIEGIEVNIDLTAEVDITLQEQTVGLEELVVTAQAPVIQRDVAGSQRNINAEEVQAAPLQNVAGVLKTQVSMNDVGSYEDRPSIRGSGFDESLFLVDGVNQGDVLTNQPHYQVNLDAVEEIKVQTGGFSAEYGNVRSGVINVVTKEGSRDRYEGSANVQYSAPGLKHFGPSPFGFESPIVEPFVREDMGAFEGGNDFFNGWNQEAAELPEGAYHAGQPMELYARYLWRHRSQDAINELKRLEEQGIVQFAEGVDPDDMVYQQTGVDPDYRASFTFGGPVPLLPVRFFVSYDRSQSEYAYRFPYRNYVDDNVRAKLTTNLTSAIKLNVHGYWSTQSGGDGGQGPGIGGFVSSNPFTATGATNKFWYPNCAVPGSRTRQIYGAQLTHTLSPTTFYQVDFTHDRVDYNLDTQLRNTAPIPGSGGITSSSGTSGSGVIEGAIGTTAEAEALAAAGQEGWGNWRDWALIQIGDVWYDEAPEGYGPVNWRDITGEYRMESCNLRVDETNTRGMEIKANLTSQLNQNNQLRAGFNVRRDVISQYYEAIDPSVNGGSVYDSKVDPWRGGVYAENKLEYKGFVATIGLRTDWMLTGKFPAVLEGCDLESGRLDCGEEGTGPYSEALQAGNTTRQEEGGRVQGTRETVIGENLPTTRHTQIRLSPRVAVSHPITSVAKIFFNYGHFYQWPDAPAMYETQLSTVNGYRVDDFGNPLLEPARTIQYEVGYEHNLFDRLKLALTGYYKDINNEWRNANFAPFGYGGANYDMAINRHYRDIRGVEAFVELRQDVLPYVSGWTSLNYLVESEADYGYDDFYEDPTRQPGFGNLEVSNPDVRPIAKTSLNFNTPDDFYGPMLGDVSLLGGISLNLLFTWQRGEAFTWNPGGYPLVEDNVRWKAYQRWDLRLRKSLFTSGRFDTQFYIDVQNLFNNRNMTRFGVENPDDGDQGWAWNGHRWFNNQDRDYLYSLGYTPENQNEDGSFNNTIGRPGDHEDDAIDMPEFSPWTFWNKRDVYFGVRVSF